MSFAFQSDKSIVRSFSHKQCVQLKIRSATEVTGYFSKNQDAGNNRIYGGMEVEERNLKASLQIIYSYTRLAEHTI